MSRSIAPFGVRMPPELKAQIEQSAKDNGRSINAEVVHRLEESIASEETLELDNAPASKEQNSLAEEALERIKHIEKILAGSKYREFVSATPEEMAMRISKAKESAAKKNKPN